MNNIKRMLALLMSLAFISSSITVNASESGNSTTETQIQHHTPVILDVDMATDVDDVTAIKIATELSVEGTIDLKGVAFSVNPGNGKEVLAMEGALDSAGLYDVPIGKASTGHYDTSPYYDALISYKKVDHTVYANAVDMYKNILSIIPDGQKARIVTTGFLFNIQSLLQDKEGYKLVKEKVDGIYIAGGEYSGLCWNLSYQPDVIAATSYVTENCPVNIYFAMDVLGANRCGGSLTMMDKDNTDFLSKCFSSFGLKDGDTYGNCDGTAVYCCAMQNFAYNGFYKAVPCSFHIDEKSGIINQAVTTKNTNTYMLETTLVKDKYALYNSKIYTDLMDSIINASYIRKVQYGSF